MSCRSRDGVCSSRGQTFPVTNAFARAIGFATIVKPVRAYLHEEDFQPFWQYKSPIWAAKFSDDWCRQVMCSQIEPMKKVARSQRGHSELILNKYRAKKQFSSVVVERLNNKVKVIFRKFYGFCTRRITEIALYYALGKLREPEIAHGLC